MEDNNALEPNVKTLVASGAQFALNLMLSSTKYDVADTTDDDSDEELHMLTAVISKRKKIRDEHRAKIRDYVEDVVSKYSFDDFRKHYRLQRTTVQHLTDLLSIHLDDDHRVHPGARKTSGLINILLPIWTLSNQESFRGISDRFGVSGGHAYRIFSQFCKVLAPMINTFISWPQGRAFEETRQGFDELREKVFPGVVGCIDGSYIRVKGLNAENDSYCTRKKFRAVILQGVCDSRKRLIDIFAGWPGSSHDARVWRNSPLFAKLQNNREAYLPSDTHLLGDSAYPLADTLMVPYKDNGHLTPKQKHFNKVLSSSRVVVENTFGLLKSRFRRLRELDMVRMDLVTTVITTACILHNICIDQDDVIDDVEEDEDLADEELGGRSTEGDDKRNRIADYLFANR